MQPVLGCTCAILAAVLIMEQGVPAIWRSMAAVSEVIGVNYGTLADDLPSPTAVVEMLQSRTAITKVKLFNADSSILTALAGTGIQVIVGIANVGVAELGDRATGAQAAAAWVSSNVASYLPATRIVGIAVGNEALLTHDKALLALIVPAMQNLHLALASLNLESVVKISSPQPLSLLHVSFPPSSGSFRKGLRKPFLVPLLSFLANTSSPFMANVYPFFAYQDNPTPDLLSYALFTSAIGYTDPSTHLHYTNMFDAQLDALFSAMSGIGFPNISIYVSETGWPSLGDPDQPGATITNAQTYINNLIKHASSNQGTPLRSGLPVQVYIFALFNEDLKVGPATERNYGIFKPDMTSVYSVPSVITTTNQSVSRASSPRASQKPTNASLWAAPQVASGVPASSPLTAPFSTLIASFFTHLTCHRLHKPSF